MKSNHTILLAIGLAVACIGHASAQSVAPSAGPAAASLPAATPRAEQQWGQAQEAFSAAQNAFAQTRAAYAGIYGSSSRSSSDSVPPVVIQFGANDAAAIGAMEEDLAVMTHIIDRAVDRVGEDAPDEKLGIKLHYTSGGKSVRALYLEGFGPLIMVKVNFPVHSPGAIDTKPAEPKEDSEWEQVRRHLNGLDEEVRWSGSSSGVPYDASRVEALKKHLIQALKNASNMKGVKPDEYVNVSVFGSPAAIAGQANGRMEGASSRRGSKREIVKAEAGRATAALDLARTTLQGTVLTLRARKSDVDAAANGSLGDEAFTKRVTVNTYAGNGHGLKSVNSWIRSSSSSGSSSSSSSSAR